MMAALNAARETVSTLLSLGADVDAVNANGKPALYAAILSGDTGTVEMLCHQTHSGKTRIADFSSMLNFNVVNFDEIGIFALYRDEKLLHKTMRIKHENNQKHFKFHSRQVNRNFKSKRIQQNRVNDKYLRKQNDIDLSKTLAIKSTEYGRLEIMEILDKDKINNYDDLMKNCLKSESVPCVILLKKMAKNHEFSQEVVQAAKNTGNVEILDLFGVLDIHMEEEKNKLYSRVTKMKTMLIRGELKFKT